MKNSNEIKTQINTRFDTVQMIQERSGKNKTADYIIVTDEFEAQSVQFARNTNFVARKSCEEVSKYNAKIKTVDCEYSAYAAAFAAEKWLEKAWNNAD